MRFSVERGGEELALTITGNLDAMTVPDIRPDVDRIAESERTGAVTVDLAGVELIDSSGVALLVSLYKRLRARGIPMHLRGVRDQPRAIFEVLRLDRVFQI